ncbi:chemotaxis-specific protein-glutamate methyltransferase CheB [Candidatus Deferrimicrobium sp.]|uniref:chemotaxis-specific protein-glutamate methyltransferase CheB n=1 Tax=Candidatus Deferrimicrobium sp. TaxID=3060586 RepID=UPI003C6F9628
MIRVLIVDDSPVVRELLTYILGSDPEIQVVGTAENGAVAVEMCSRFSPDVITMDIRMPVMDGYEATRRIMRDHPLPVVVVSESFEKKEVEGSFRAVEAGALTILRKPVGIGHPDHEKLARELIRTVKLMSEVKVVRRWRREGDGEAPRGSLPPAPILSSGTPEIEVVVIGASTGGPVVIQSLLSGIPGNFPVPILFVQHMADGFIRGLVDWLNRTSNLPVRIAEEHEFILPGNVYVAPSGSQMILRQGGRISYTKDAGEFGLCPSVSQLFLSAAQVYGTKALAVLLTGMGRDGAAEMKMLKDLGAVTIAQDRESSVIYGMPGEAVRIGAATHILSPERIVKEIVRLTKRRNREGSA